MLDVLCDCRQEWILSCLSGNLRVIVMEASSSLSHLHGFGKHQIRLSEQPLLDSLAAESMDWAIS